MRHASARLSPAAILAALALSGGALHAQDSVASAQASLSGDHVRLYKALGGGWTPDANTESPGGQTPATTR